MVFRVALVLRHAHHDREGQRRRRPGRQGRERLARASRLRLVPGVSRLGRGLDRSAPAPLRKGAPALARQAQRAPTTSRT